MDYFSVPCSYSKQVTVVDIVDAIQIDYKSHEIEHFKSGDAIVPYAIKITIQLTATDDYSIVCSVKEDKSLRNIPCDFGGHGASLLGYNTYDTHTEFFQVQPGEKVGNSIFTATVTDSMGSTTSAPFEIIYGGYL